jgi:hypothetical protein
MTVDFFFYFLVGALCFTAVFSIISLVLIAFPKLIPAWIRSNPRRLLPAAAALAAVGFGCWWIRSDYHLRCVFALHRADFDAFARMATEDSPVARSIRDLPATRVSEYQRVMGRIGVVQLNADPVIDYPELELMIRDDDDGAARTSYVYSTKTLHSEERKGDGYSEYLEYTPLADGWYILHQSF